MISEQLRLLVDYRFLEAKQTLEEARILVINCAYRGSINRSYYAMFYAAMGLLSLKTLGSSKHSGVISFFDREFVKTGELSKDLSRSFHRAFQERQMSDRQFKNEVHQCLMIIHRIPQKGFDSQDIFEDDD